MDYLDIISGRFYSTLTGKYFEKVPIGATLKTEAGTPDNRAVGIPIDYETVDPTEWRYKNLISNLIEREAATLTIMTREQLRFKAGAYILTMDGRLCEIISVTEDTKTAQREAARYFPAPLGTEYILRLVERENPWGIA